VARRQGNGDQNAYQSVKSAGRPLYLSQSLSDPANTAYCAIANQKPSNILGICDL
jgi:hypothetical protein